MDQTRPRGKKRIWWLAAVLSPLLLLAAGLYLLGNGGVSDRYDDVRAIVGGYVSGSYDRAELLPDGTVSARLTRDDLYWYADRYGLGAPLLEELAGAGISPQGFRVVNGEAIAYLRVRILGLLPVTLRAELDAALDESGQSLALRTTTVHLGRYLPLPRAAWPGLLRNDIYLPLGIYAGGVQDAWLEEDALALTLDGLRSVPSGQLRPDRELLAAIRVFVPETERQDDPVLSFFAGLERDAFPAADAWTLALSAEDPGAALTRLLALCTDASVSEVLSGLDPLLRDTLGPRLLDSSREARQLWDATLRDEQSQYERVLTSLREMYKSGSLQIGETAFYNVSTGEAVTPAGLTGLSATATDSRLVFLYSDTGSEAVCVEDMPPIGDIPREDRRTMRDLLDPEAAYDLGAVLTSEGGTPLLLHRRQDGTFVLREISEALYVSLLVESSNPVLRVEDLPAPGWEIRRPAGEGWTGAVITLLDPQ